MIFYFSGTGNSRYAAELISKVADDELVSMNKLIKAKSKAAHKSENPFVFVCPVYAGRIPRIVEKYIRETKFELLGFNSIVMPQGYIAMGGTKPPANQ